MKEWKKPVVGELTITETQSGTVINVNEGLPAGTDLSGNPLTGVNGYYPTAS